MLTIFRFAASLSLALLVLLIRCYSSDSSPTTSSSQEDNPSKGLTKKAQGLSRQSAHTLLANHQGTIPLPAASFPVTSSLSEQQELEISQASNREIFQNIIKLALKQNWHQWPMGETMQAIAAQFLGAQYQESLLDRFNQETIFVSLSQFDCILFVETVLALARGIAVQDYSYQSLINNIVEQRYRNGYMDGYCSRLHYFSQWVSDNHQRKSVKNITPTLGGFLLKKKLNFMSTHRHSYPQLVNNEANYHCIVEMETNLARLDIHYIPHQQIKGLYSQLQPGDIVGIATNTPGLDVIHTGLIYRTPKGNLGLIHASRIGQVTIASDLHTYVKNRKNALGILVARPMTPLGSNSTPINLHQLFGSSPVAPLLASRIASDN